MSDKKISELPSASTPLAGTEAVPLVQGGITEQVSVANLTAGRDVSAKSLIVSDNSANAALRITQTGSGNALLVEDEANPDSTPFVINNVGNVGIGLSTIPAGYKLELAPDAAGAVLRLRGGSGGSSLTQFTDSVASAQWGTLTATAASISLAHSAILAFTTNTVERIRIASTGIISLGATAGSESLRVAPVASAVNFMQIQGSATGGVPTIISTGSDTNVPLAFLTKGTGYYNFQTSGGAQFIVNHTASAVNYLQVTGAATAGAPNILATGSDTNVSFIVSTKGNGSHFFQTNSNGLNQFVIAHTASAVNQLQVTGSATGNALTMSAVGTDTNIDLALTPKGTGVLRFGTYTAGILAQAGYITIKDAAGNTRNLLVG